MNHRTGLSRQQTLLFPETLDDYITVENPVRFLDAFVAGLDLHALGFAKAVPEPCTDALTLTAALAMVLPFRRGWKDKDWFRLME